MTRLIRPIALATLIVAASVPAGAQPKAEPPTPTGVIFQADTFCIDECPKPQIPLGGSHVHVVR